MKHRIPDAKQLALFKRSPMKFREFLLVDGARGELTPFKDAMSPLQRKDFEAIDPALAWTAGASRVMEGKEVPYPVPPCVRFYFQRSRGYSKTSDRAMDILWLLSFGKKATDGIVVAEDKDQASLVVVQARKIVALNPWIANYVEISDSNNRIINKSTGAFIKTLSRDKNSSWGLTCDFLMCDEWTHWSQEEFWESIFSSFAKKEKLMIVSCNAGEGQDWKWRNMKHFESSPQWYFSAPDGYAPWYSEANIAEQQATLDPFTFNRVWLNRWQEDGSQFLMKHTIEACVDPELEPRDGPEDDVENYIISFDYGEIKDRAVGVVAHWKYDFENQVDEVVVDRMDVFEPTLSPQGSVQLKDVQDWLETMYTKFSANNRNVYFVLDRYQLLQILQYLKTICPPENIAEFEFASGNGNFEMSKLLQQRVISKRVKWYKGCGEIFMEDGQVFRPRGSMIPDDLNSELVELVKVDRPNGKWRFDHPRWGHDDRAFALGAVLWLIGKEQKNMTGEGGLMEEIL